jgi:predicted acyl esterase
MLICTIPVKKNGKHLINGRLQRQMHVKFYLNNDGKLADAAASRNRFGTSFVSDPMKPVPYTEDNTTTMGFTPHNYMSEDQRFAGRRTDVLVYQTDVLADDVTLGGEIMANLKVATTGTDADFDGKTD